METIKDEEFFRRARQKGWAGPWEKIMKKATVVELSKAAQAARMAAENMALMNMPMDAEKRVESAAAFRIAMDMADKAEEEYRNAFDKWADAGYPE